MFISNSRRLRALAREELFKSKNLKIRTISQSDLSSYNKKIYNTQSKRDLANSMIQEDEIYYDGSAIKIPSGIDPVSVILHDNLSNESLSLIIFSLQDPEQQWKDNELPDDVIQGLEEIKNFRKLNPSTSSKLTHNRVTGSNSGKRIYPDGWELSYYPAGKRGRRGKEHHGKPNIDVIKMWVKDTKLAGKSQMQLEDEYRRVRGSEGNVSWDDDKYDALVDSIAYLVARKLWYVGRRSSRETDEQWQEHTKDMRPPEGSYEPNENWGGNFPYGEEYTYTSGEQ
jgi:hypothetical protein